MLQMYYLYNLYIICVKKQHFKSFQWISVWVLRAVAHHAQASRAGHTSLRTCYLLAARRSSDSKWSLSPRVQAWSPVKTLATKKNFRHFKRKKNFSRDYSLHTQSSMPLCKGNPFHGPFAQLSHRNHENSILPHRSSSIQVWLQPLPSVPAPVGRPLGKALENIRDCALQGRALLASYLITREVSFKSSQLTSRVVHDPLPA